MQPTSIPTQDKLTEILQSLTPTTIAVIDETFKHKGHAGAAGGGGHFIVRIVSEQFRGISRLDRHRMVFNLLRAEMGIHIHALTLQAQTPEEAG